MYRVLIVDDEKIIRNGIRNLLLKDAELEVVGEAEDGEIALQKVEELAPDIIFLDICMPFINGVEFIEKIVQKGADSLIIIISGHNEFVYAQKAIKFHVFDYLLKPIMDEVLFATINRAKQKILTNKSTNKYIKWANNQMEKNREYLLEDFMNQWLNGHLCDFEIKEQINFLSLKFSKKIGIMGIKILDNKIKTEKINDDWDNGLLFYAVKNIVSELMSGFEPLISFKNRKDDLIVIASYTSPSEWAEKCIEIKDAILKNLIKDILISHRNISNDIKELPAAYENILIEMSEKSTGTPLVVLVKNYIDKNYHRENLSLQDAADIAHISPQHLSRVFRQELNVTFVDYLTQIRILKAIELISDPTLKIYEVAEKVGYNSQHYFSSAFKKVLGVSPLEYRKGVQSEQK